MFKSRRHPPARELRAPLSAPLCRSCRSSLCVTLAPGVAQDPVAGTRCGGQALGQAHWHLHVVSAAWKELSSLVTRSQTIAEGLIPRKAPESGSLPLLLDTCLRRHMDSQTVGMSTCLTCRSSSALCYGAWETDHDRHSYVTLAVSHPVAVSPVLVPIQCSQGAQGGPGVSPSSAAGNLGR